MNSITNLTPQQLRQAADIQERIAGLQAELQQILGTPAQEPAQEIFPSLPRKRRLSAQGLANIRAGARRRWAKEHAESANGAAPARPRRKMSAAARAAISARMKTRWAAAKRSGRNAL
jgi:hypothetical protein